jgi:GNAT superfamily N-acetyltransferase
MEFEIRTLSGVDTAAFARFTFPAYRNQLGAAAGPSVVASGLLSECAAAGLALGIISPEDPARARVLSILVEAATRGRGAGRRLLEAFETELARRGCRTVSGELTGSEDRSLPIEKLLARSGWHFAGPSSILCHAYGQRMLEAPWLAEAKLPEEMTMFPWLELKPSERAAMLTRQASERWFPENLSPFWNESSIAGCSVGMRYKGRVAGWCVTWKFEGDTLRWWRMFVEPELQRTGRAVPLLAETIRRAPSYGFHYGLWSMRTDNQAMMRLFRRRMRPWLISAKPVWGVSKQIGLTV